MQITELIEGGMLVTERDITVARTHVGGHNSAQSHFQQDILCLSSLYVELGLLLQGGKKMSPKPCLLTGNSLNNQELSQPIV